MLETIEENKIGIGKRIEYARKYKMLKKMTKEEFADTIDISGSHLGKIEHGLKGLSIPTLIKICKKANVSADYILFGKENNLIEQEIKEVLSDFNEEQIEIVFAMFKALIQHLKQQN